MGYQGRRSSSGFTELLKICVEYLDRCLREICRNQKVMPTGLGQSKAGENRPGLNDFIDGHCSGVTAGFHAEMVPFNVAKINEAGAGVLPGTLVIIKSVVPLKTIPVGAEAPFAPGALGTVTGVVATIVPVPVYRVEGRSPALFTHQGLDALGARPQAFLRFGSSDCHSLSINVCQIGNQVGLRVVLRECSDWRKR